MFNGTFDINGDYRVLINFRAKDGYKITENTLNNIKVNGRSLDTNDGDETFGVDNNGESARVIVKISPQAVVKGDFNGNDEVDLADVIYLLRLYLGVEDETDENLLIGDMNSDGNIGLNDVILLLRTYLGVE